MTIFSFTIFFSEQKKTIRSNGKSFTGCFESNNLIVQMANHSRDASFDDFDLFFNCQMNLNDVENKKVIYILI